MCAALAKKSSVYLDLIISVLDRVFEYVKRGSIQLIDAGVGLIASIGGASTEVSVKRKCISYIYSCSSFESALDKKELDDDDINCRNIALDAFNKMLSLQAGCSRRRLLS